AYGRADRRPAILIQSTEPLLHEPKDYRSGALTVVAFYPLPTTAGYHLKPALPLPLCLDVWHHFRANSALRRVCIGPNPVKPISVDAECDLRLAFSGIRRSSAM